MGVERFGQCLPSDDSPVHELGSPLSRAVCGSGAGGEVSARSATLFAVAFLPLSARNERGGVGGRGPLTPPTPAAPARRRRAAPRSRTSPASRRSSRRTVPAPPPCATP